MTNIQLVMAEREHGSISGVWQHWYRKDKICPECSAVRKIYDLPENKKLRAFARSKPRRKVAECGTQAGYTRHILNKEPTDAACRAAHAAAARKSRRGY